LVKRCVGPLEERVAAIGVPTGSDTDTDRDMQGFVLMVKGVRRECDAQPVSDYQCFNVGCAPQNNQKLLPAVAVDLIGLSQGVADQGGNELQGHVADSVSFFIIDSLEMIHIHNKQGKVAAAA